MNQNLPTEDTVPFKEWCNVELFGHQRVIGLVTEAQIAGGKFLRVEALDGNGQTTTRFYGAGAVYCITPCTEEIARSLAARYGSSPIDRFDLGKLLPQASSSDDSEEGEDGLE